MKRAAYGRRRRAGFTLVELMVALTIGALVVAAIFTIGGASSRHFQEQQRLGSTQRAVRFAMDRLRRDLDRAGYGSVPDTNSPRVRMCPAPAVARRIQAVWFANDDLAGNTALAAVNRAANGVSADRLRLVGNYASDESYKARAFTGSTVILQSDWFGFRRSFVAPGATTVDTARFAQVFAPGRMLHIETETGFDLFVRITGAAVDAQGATPTITISPALSDDNVCLRGFGRGSIVTPIAEIQYSIATSPTTSNLAPVATEVTGPNTQLVREELDMQTGAAIAGTRRVLLDYAVDFNLAFVIDTNTNLSQPPALARREGALAQTALTNAPWQVRSVIASIAARTPEQDPRFPWPWTGNRPSTQPLRAFRVFSARPGAARVRQLETEVLLPNLATQ